MYSFMIGRYGLDSMLDLYDGTLLIYCECEITLYSELVCFTACSFRFSKSVRQSKFEFSV